MKERVQVRIYYLAQTAQTIHPSDRFFDQLPVVLHTYGRDAYATLMVTRKPKNYFLRLRDGIRCED